ncbi:ABC transporter permease [Pollutibacter soli]|uniref:ABC transporter permease n=1 Tax=Pollutibacter soli TaxID=3034157 RepID=UPI0030132DFC
MINNYFKTLFRNLARNKGYSFLNITGLAVGMAAAMLILLWIQNQLSMERFHEKGDRIYVMYNRDTDPEGNKWAWNSTPKILGPTLKADYPEVEDFTRFNNITFLLTSGEKRMNKRGAFADSSFLNIFSFPLLEGTVATSLQNSYSIVLTEKFAKALFGNEKALGKTIRIDSVNNCTVTAVLKDLPNNTLFEFEYLLPWSYMRKLDWDDKHWGNNSVRTYTLLKPGASQANFDKKIRTITIDHSKGSADQVTTEVFTQPLNRYYLYGRSEDGRLTGGQIETVRLFGIIAAFILLIACINFMNLSTARSEKRAKEVGIRKVVGVGKKSLILQFLTESIILSFISFLLALLIVTLSLKGFNQLVNKQLFIPFTNPVFWFTVVCFIVFTGIVAGSYPAFYLSSFRPVAVLKGTFKKANALIAPRKILVAVQFTFAIILIISTMIVVRQLQYGLNRQSGYDRNNLVYTFTQGEVDKHYQAIRNELLSSGTAVSVTRSSNPITQRWSDSWGFAWEGSTKADEKIDFIRLGSDAEFTKTTGVQLLDGRDIDVYNFKTDSTAVLLNESAVKAMRLKKPIGTNIHYVGDTNYYHVIGVIKDFVLESPFQEKINPVMVFGPGMDYGQVIHAKLNPARGTATNLKSMEAIFTKYNPQYPFEAIFTDESYARKFRDQQQTSKLAALFAGLTIFISCLGLFGLAAYMAESRTKEVGVRKVLGASVFSVTNLLSKDFLKLVLISFVIASPVTWYAMNKWLQGYSYRISIEWWVFVLAGVLAIVIALLTVSFQAVKAALANPVRSLRSE